MGYLKKIEYKIVPIYKPLEKKSRGFSILQPVCKIKI